MANNLNNSRTTTTIQLQELEALVRSPDDIAPEAFEAVVAALKLVNERMNDIAGSYQKREAELVRLTQELELEEQQLQQFKAHYDEIATKDAAANAAALRDAEPLSTEQYLKMMAPVSLSSLAPSLCGFSPDGTLGHETSTVGYQRQSSSADGTKELFLRVCLNSNSHSKTTTASTTSSTTTTDMAVETGLAAADPLLICEQRIPLEYLKLC